MEEIKIGEYVRLSNAKIGKVIAIEKGSIMLDIVENRWVGICSISKHSFNIIDLIEVGDIVTVFSDLHDRMGNQTFIVENEEHLKYLLTGFNSGYFHLKSIVTKEQFESIKYEVIK